MERRLMLKIYSNSERVAKFKYEMENICQLFFPNEKIVGVMCGENDVEGQLDEGLAESISVHLKVVDGEDGCEFQARVRDIGCEVVKKERKASYFEIAKDDERERELAAAGVLYDAFAECLGFELEWGAVTGVRPIKLFRNMVKEYGIDGAKKWFRNSLKVNAAKTDLCEEIYHNENKIIALSKPNSFSLYISIPFCPTRCDYCSFVSHTVEKAVHLIPTYIKNLCAELELTASIVKKLGLKLETVYIGGGTPTSIDVSWIDVLLRCVEDNFDLSTVLEYTVEAGRPDTIDLDKMRVLKSYGVSRVSINPQTLHDDILANIGRRHTVDDFYNAIEIAKKVGFNTINVDLIAALPGDTLEGFKRSIDGVIALEPENITVHTLALKRASNLSQNELANSTNESRKLAGAMVAYSGEALRRGRGGYSYIPYYLYRQSRVIGNMENVGWGLTREQSHENVAVQKNHEGLYNVYIMDETHSIIACGAGAVTKLRNPHKVQQGEFKIKRIFNFKFPYEYTDVEKFGELLERKLSIVDFYNKINARNNENIFLG